MKRLGYILLCLIGLVLFSCERELQSPEPMVMKTIHYQVTAGQAASSKATLDGSDHYIFQEGDRLYVNATGTGADKLYGFLHLIKGAGTETAVFDGDLYCHYEFEPTSETELNVTLVGADDDIHRVSDGGGRITAVEYPSSACAATFAEAVRKYSHFTDSGHYGDVRFTLAQQSSFLRVSLKFGASEVPEGTEITVKILNGSTELRAFTVEAEEVGAVSWARFVASFPGETELSDGQITYQKGSGAPETLNALNSGSAVTLAANTYYDVFRSLLPIWNGFKIKATVDGTSITFNYAEPGDKVYYSKDDGLTWTYYKTTDGAISLNAGEELCFKGERTSYKHVISYPSGGGDSWAPTYTPLFSSSGNKLCYISGDMRSLLYGEDFSSNSAIPDNAFTGCFCQANWINIESDEAAGTLLQAETIGEGSCEDMFFGCTTLTRPLDFLHTTSFGKYSCRGMFRKCTGIDTASTFSTEPTTVAEGCFFNMFRLCSKLKNIPSIFPAAVMSKDCYREMFRSCTQLKEVNPGMLPAMTMAETCYRQMFNGCSQLTNSPNLPATVLASGCYHSMFSGCSRLESAPTLSAPVLVKECYCQLFYNCNKLKTITCLATTITATDAHKQWVFSVGTNATGTKTFYKSPDISESTWGSGESGIPTGWTVVDYPAP